MSLYFFHGQEEFLMEKEIGKLKNKLLDKSFISMNYKVFHSPKFADLMDILSTQPMMFGNSLIIIEIDNYLNSKKGSEKEEAEENENAEELETSTEEESRGTELNQIEDNNSSQFDDKQFAQIKKALSCVPEQINIIFVYKINRNSTKKIDTRKKLYKILNEACEVKEFKQLPAYDKKALPATITNLAKELELELTTTCASKIIEMLGSNLRIINSELEKLKLFIYPNKRPSIEDIEKICTTTKDIFKLIDCFILSNKDAALNEFMLLTQTQHPLQIIATLQSTISRLINIKLLSRTLSTFDIAKQLKIHEYRISLELNKIRDYKYDQLLQLKNKITDCEFKIKSGQNYSAELAVEQLLLDKVE